MNKTSLLYWWPRVKDLGIPVPKTHIMPVDWRVIVPAFDGEPLSLEFLSELREAAEVIGFPLFLRTDLQSGKHGWKDTCYIPDESYLQRNMLGVVEENECGACMFGPQFEALVFREFLQLETSFKAFREFPVNRERRYFVENGKILCHHPYWPEFAIEGHTDAEGWRERLAILNEEPDSEVGFLSEYACKVSSALPGFWSVDLAKAKDGMWYLIDMALGRESFHWKGCHNERLQV